MQVEGELRIHDREAPVHGDDLQARRTRSPGQAIDVVVWHTPGPFDHLVQEIPVGAESVELGV